MSHLLAASAFSTSISAVQREVRLNSFPSFEHDKNTADIGSIVPRSMIERAGGEKALATIRLSDELKIHRRRDGGRVRRPVNGKRGHKTSKFHTLKNDKAVVMNESFVGERWMNNYFEIAPCVRRHWDQRFIVEIRTIVSCGSCKFDLRHAASKYVPADRLSLARTLYCFLLRSGAPLPEPFDSLDDVTVCYGMEWFAYFRNSGSSGKALRASAQNAVFGLNDLYSWPDSFASALVELDHFSKNGYGFGKECASLVEKIDRAGSVALRNVLLAHAADTLNAPTLYVVADQQPLS